MPDTVEGLIYRKVTQQRNRSESREKIQSTSMVQSIRNKGMRYAMKMTPKQRLESRDQRLSDCRTIEYQQRR
jgi:hypothetical protein